MDALERSLDGENLSILRCLRHRGLDQQLPIYLVGGPVRDVLTGRPIKDLDFVVEGDATELARWLAAQLGGEIRSHPRFGTSTVTLGSSRVDVVTARRETYPQPAALPDVTRGTIQDDLARRDFSINSLALPLREETPEVMDPHGGTEDIRHGLVRTLHPQSFVDDPTRIFRAVRYEQRLGFRIEDGTLSELGAAVAQGLLSALTGDRLRHELERFLEEDRPELGLMRCAELGILEAIHPEIGGGHAVDRLRAIAGERQGSPAQLASLPLTFIAAMVYPLSLEQCEAAIQRLNAPNLWMRVIRDIIGLKYRVQELAAETLNPSQLTQIAAGYSQESLLALARLGGSPLIAARLEEYLDRLQYMTPVLNGEDLLAMGVPQGPLVGRALRHLKETKLNGQAETEAQERNLVREFLKHRDQPLSK